MDPKPDCSVRAQTQTTVSLMLLMTCRAMSRLTCFMGSLPLSLEQNKTQTSHEGASYCFPQICSFWFIYNGKNSQLKN